MLNRNKDFQYKRVYGKISGYTTTYNAMNYPFEECIKSMLGFCEEVVVLDGVSDDGTWEKLEELAKQDSRVKLYQNQFDWENEPTIDGMQKAYARALCENEYLWQQDADEIVHEDDYEKIKLITKRFPKTHDILHLPVVELWADPYHATGRRHCWKFRMSKNKPEITHSVCNHARLTNEKTGRVYSKKNCDGCCYVNTMTYEPLSNVGFYNEQIELARLHMPDAYAQGINEVFEKIPSVWHTSWMDISRKLEQLKPEGMWDKLWSGLYNEKTQNRFPDTDFNKKEEVDKLVEKLYNQGGEDSDQVKYKFKLTKQPPKLLSEWIKKQNGRS